MATEIKTLCHCAYSLSFHLVLVTKYRRRCLSSKMLEELQELFSEQLVLKNGLLKEFNGEADHVHLLIELPPNQALSNVVNSLKSTTSRAIRKRNSAALLKHYKKPVLWSRSYFVNSVGGANLETVMAYIQGQTRPA